MCVCAHVCLYSCAQWHMDAYALGYALGYAHTLLLSLWTSLRLHAGSQSQIHRLPKRAGAPTEAVVAESREGVVAEGDTRSTGPFGCIKVDHSFEGTLTCVEEDNRNTHSHLLIKCEKKRYIYIPTYNVVLTSAIAHT